LFAIAGKSVRRMTGRGIRRTASFGRRRRRRRWWKRKEMGRRGNLEIHWLYQKERESTNGDDDGEWMNENERWLF
jgi:hypothetical protein